MSLDHQDLVARIWARDHTVWKPDPGEIADRLGWLDVATEMRARVPELRRFAADAVAEGIGTVVLLGMGGSSLAPEVLRHTLGASEGMCDLIVLDTTHPDAIARVERSIDLDRTLFLVASKSGTTVETLSHLAYFAAKAPPSRFLAITDPGTPLEERARAEGFRAVFLNPPDIGGRYSALSLFGLVPAALIGADLDALIGSAERMASACRASSPAENPGLSLGVAIGNAAIAGRDKCTLVASPALAPIGVWVEQLIAESLGKEGRGVVPVVDEPALETDTGDRLFVVYGDAGHPTGDAVRLPEVRAQDLGGEFFRWEFATAVAGTILGVNPFDQPDVEAAKKAARARLQTDGSDTADEDDLEALIDLAGPRDYIAIQAYVDPTEASLARLTAWRTQLRARTGCATTLGIGPRYLHSTGQLHKGGADNVVCLQVVEEPVADLPIPGAPYTFGELIRAQARGDLEALRARGRRVGRVGRIPS